MSFLSFYLSTCGLHPWICTLPLSPPCVFSLQDIPLWVPPRFFFIPFRKFSIFLFLCQRVSWVNPKNEVGNLLYPWLTIFNYPKHHSMPPLRWEFFFSTTRPSSNHNFLEKGKNRNSKIFPLSIRKNGSLVKVIFFEGKSNPHQFPLMVSWPILLLPPSASWFDFPY